MVPGLESTQRPRRPTAFEVSFPNEFSGDKDDGEEGEEDEDAVNEGDNEQVSRRGKRKHDSTARSDGRPAKRHNHHPPPGLVEEDGEKEMYYTPRPDELPESAPDIAFLLGEDDAPNPAGEGDDGGEMDKKPVRVLHDWSVFDARPRPKKRGELALHMLPLDALDTPSSGCSPEGAGVAAPLFENDEDAGQEDDGDYDDDGEGEDEAKAVSVRLRLGALLRYTIDYTKSDDPIFIETTTAWYILGVPAREYRAYYAPFFRAHKIAQALVCALVCDPDMSLEAFVSELEASACSALGSGGTCTPRDLQDAIPAIHAALDTLDEPTYRALRGAPLLQLILDVPGSERGAASLPMRRTHMRQGQGPRVSSRRAPFRLLPATMGNLDLAVLRPENQRPTHVTPRIAELAAGLFREQLVVLGRRPSAAPATRRRMGGGGLSGNSREEWSSLRRAVAMALCPEGTQSVEAPTRWRLHPRQPFMHCVGLVDVRGQVPKALFKVGDVVLVPIGEDETKRGHVPVPLPLTPDATPRDSRLSDYFWFGRVVHINGQDERVHIQWFDYAPNTFLDDIGDPRELFLTPLCDTLPLVALCGTVPVADFSARASVPDDYDGYFFRFVYDKTDASFSEPLPTPPHADPPYNCTVCARREEEEIEAHGRVVRRAGGVAGVAVHGTTFHVGDFALVRAEEGPSRIAQLVGVFTSDPVWVKLQLLGRVSDLADLLPPDELCDERHLFFTDEFEEAPVENLLAQCFVLHHDLIFDMDLWATLGPAHFYYRYRFAQRRPASWDERMPLAEDAGVGCSTCAFALQTRLAEAVAFEEEAQARKLRVLDVFAGAGAMSLGMESATSGMKTTHAIELGPSAARTFRRNSPGTIVYNQCANEVLRYAVKSHRGLLMDDDVPKDIYDNSPLPPPPRPGDIDVIVAGFPCQPHSQLNMFQKANDVKSNLILNLLSWVDFLEPPYCVFENVRGFLSYNLRAVQLDEHRTAGGISMGGLKFLVHAMLAMNYQVRFCLLQAAHYGTPQTRVRFFLFAARRGHPLPSAPQPTHDFPRTHRLEVHFPNGDIARAVHAEVGTAPFRFVSIDDAISDLPRFDWKNPSLNRLSAQKRAEARERAERVPALRCDQTKKHIGFEGPVSGAGLRYHHAPRTSFQAWCRRRRTEDLQHFTRALKPATVERVVNIPLIARADYRSLEKEHWEWQFSDPASAIARKGFRPGLYGRLDKDFVFQTTVTNVEPTAKQSRVLNPYCHRMVTVRELARSQGFPDSFVFHSINDDVVTMHRQIGNAVPWPVAAAIGRELREARLKKWRKDRQDAMVIE
ncbi:S-adenosyl-L-methionine-dependent methyltransferase [Lactarius hatsudake]|nr:S-adenosyl-L-methionine-dependent methyltransferase [Lactarius hatsudake]